MTAGFQVVGSHGLLQIDERYTSLGLRAKGSMSITGPATLVVTDVQTPMLAISAPSAPVLLTGAVQSGGTVTYTLTSAAATALDWWLFDKMTPPAGGSHGAGLQVYTADGQCAFDSTSPPMRIAGLLRLPDAPANAAWPPTPGALSGPAGAYAACLSHPRVYLTDGQQPNRWFADGVQTSPTGCTTGQVYYRSHPPGSNGFGGERYMQAQGGLLFLVDVTGL